MLALISAIMALTALAIDLMLSVFDDIRETFDLAENSNATGQIVTVFLFGLAVAQMIYGPLSDRYGRKPVLYLGIAIYTLGAVGSALAPTFELLLVSRFVWGLGAAGARVVATAVIRDRFEGNAMAKAMSQIMAVFMIVPVFAPSVGALINAVVPWRGLFWFCVIVAAVVGLWSLRMVESLNPADVRPLNARGIFDGFVEVFRTPITCGYTMSTVFLQGVFTAYLASSELMISEVFDRGDQFPVIFGVVAILFAIGALINGSLVERLGIDRLVDIALLVQAPIIVALVIVSVSAGGRPSFWVFMPLLGLTLGTFMLLTPNLNSAAMVPVGHIAGTASAATGAVRIFGGALFGTIISSLTTTSVTPFAVGLALLTTCSGLTVALVRYRAARAVRNSGALPTGSAS